MFGHVFFAAPHRVMFATGALQLILALLLWSLELALRAGGGGGVLAALPSGWWHPLLMVFGFFPFMIFGFLMTALPKWVGVRSLGQAQFLPAFFAMAGGWLLFYLGASGGAVLLCGLGVGVAGIGALLGAHALWQAASASDNPDRRHSFAAIGAVVVAALLQFWLAVALVRGDGTGVRAAAMLGLWAFVAPSFVIVAHRMLPFFTQSAVPGLVPYRPMWLLYALLGGLVLRGLASVFVTTDWLFPLEAAMALLALRLTVKWRFRASFRVPLLATHHIGFAWLSIALALFALQDGLAAFGIAWGGFVPLHALTLGFFVSMLFGMATRVTHGHSGMPIVAPAWVWRAFWVLEACIVLRLAADFAPPAMAAWLLPLSGAGMAAVFIRWAASYLGCFFRPRADGEAG
jgi:uncharacterized protein involved in response to NO